MRFKLTFAMLLGLAFCVPVSAIHFKVGPFKVSSKKPDKIIAEIKKGGDKVVSVAKGPGKWFKTEVWTTLNGERHLVIKPYIALTHDGQSIKVGPDEAHIKVAGLSLKTGHLRERLAQIGCVVASEGAAAQICATDLLEKVIKEEAGEIGIPADAVGGEPPIITDAKETNFCQTMPETNSCFTPSKRLVGSVCACFSPDGDFVVGTAEASTKPAKDGLTEMRLPPPRSDHPGFSFDER